MARGRLRGGETWAGIAGDLREIPKRYQRGITRLHGALRNGWWRIVKKSTWYSPVPSPDRMVIFKVLGDTRLEFGWEDYKGSPAHAKRRFDLRKPLLNDLLSKYFRTFKIL